MGRWKEALPHGNTLSSPEFELRHRAILVVLALHVVGVPFFALARGFTLWHGLLEASIVAGPAVFALGRGNRRARAVAASIGTMGASAVITHLSGGMIEAHFHFFVMVPIIALYHDWIPFLVALGYVVAHHGAMGVVDPDSVYNHYAAFNNPWKWAAIHGLFILGISTVCVISWRLNEQVLDQRRRAEDGLRDALSVLEGTLEATADGVLVVGRNGYWTTWNERFVEMWQIPEEIVAARDSRVAMGYVARSVEDPHAFVAKIDDLYAEPEATSLDEIRFLDGRVFERTSKPHRVNGEAVGRVWSFRDITSREANAAKLRDAVASLEARDESKNLFLTAISHELRTPLAAVVGYAHTLRDHDRRIADDTRADFLERLVSKADKLERLLLNLLDLDRLVRGTLEPKRQPVALRPLISNLVEHADLDSSRLRLDIDPLIASVDGPMIERVVENLVVNAIKHAASGTMVEVRARACDADLVLQIEDRGDGVPDEMKGRIFEPFVRGDDSSPTPATGVGLALVARFVELHGGEVKVEDRLGGGSTFTVLVPDAIVRVDEDVRAAG